MSQVKTRSKLWLMLVIILSFFTLSNLCKICCVVCAKLFIYLMAKKSIFKSMYTETSLGRQFAEQFCSNWYHLYPLFSIPVSTFLRQFFFWSSPWSTPLECLSSLSVLKNKCFFCKKKNPKKQN